MWLAGHKNATTKIYFIFARQCHATHGAARRCQARWRVALPGAVARGVAWLGNAGPG
jgi:hypothetical protein